MPVLDDLAPPDLVLPLQPWDAAEDALAQALAALDRARDVEWVSVAAGEYRSQIAEIEVRVRALAVDVGRSRDACQRARALAWMHGQ